ncbi:hypothetical protein AcW2_000050 [Taiwanofungus camphoratus]|nr:hypothetical protein AcW2_000050 [Antrodia cinnamomea]
MYKPDPWYLTVVRTQGLLFIRPEKSWRPIVAVVVVGRDQTQEIVLGCDGQNPNLKNPLVLHDVDHATRLDIKVWHKSHSKNRKKRHLVGSAYVSLGEVLKKQKWAGSNLDIRLSCPPPQKKSPTIGGRQRHCATLTIRLRAPTSLSPVATAAVSSTSQHEDDHMSDAGPSSRALSETLVSPTVKESVEGWRNQVDSPPEDSSHQLRRRRVKGYVLNSDDEAGPSSRESSCPPTPHDNYFPTLEDVHKQEKFEEDAICVEQSEGVWSLFAPMSLPRYVDQISVQNTLSLAETIADMLGPYRDLQEATLDSDYEKILGRLLTEWYVVGASLLALAGIDAAVFGFTPGSLFAVDGLAQRVVAIGAIAAGIGIVFDAWFLVVYSSANAAKFQRLALDVYGSYFFFCLICRLPTLCTFGSAFALMLFLLGVAWNAWPSAVLVMSFLSGVLLTLQYLVFGCHRLFNMVMWATRGLWRKLRGNRDSKEGVSPNGVANGENGCSPSAGE